MSSSSIEVPVMPIYSLLLFEEFQMKWLQAKSYVPYLEPCVSILDEWDAAMFSCLQYLKPHVC